jgi:catechol 2,3-dioxygenase-like lactoylglutathione lyase family enzyme
MFQDTEAFSGFAVGDIEAARAFYADTLGVRVTEANGLLTLHLSGGARPTLIYPKPGHVPAEYTILNFPVADIEAAVDELTARGVTFQRYPGMDETDERGIFRGGGPLIAWFTDPAGNILSVLEQ